MKFGHELLNDILKCYKNREGNKVWKFQRLD